MKVLVTGANGFLGHYLIDQLLNKGYEVIATGKGACRLPFLKRAGLNYLEMDFTDPFAVHDVFQLTRPDVVVHAGAISKPDDCELQQASAYSINVEGTMNMLLNAEEHRAFFVFLSTDFVFDGERGMYNEEDKTNPVNYYGRTKAEAEEAVFEYANEWAVARTVLVYGRPVQARENILSIVAQKLGKGESYAVVDDQWRTPTYVGDLADGICRIIDRKACGVFHLSGSEIRTPYEMAVEAARYLKLDESLIKRVTAADFTQPAKRPVRTGFEIGKARSELGYAPISFEAGLAATFG